ncbi:MAG: ChbG/HpnK family deacetylase [Candidatus Dojkabacteria bacterium]|nr:MAG: ChbG/HpnK family deacetylase [Candidatus Dojkabacteria bacterium]
MKKKLIINGHDLGFSHAINEGFQYLLEKYPRVLSEISILPNGLASEEAVAIAKESGVAVNLCMCFANSKFKGLSGRSTLTDEKGYLKNADTISWDFSVIDSFSEEDIKREIEAQYQWFLDRFGKKPSAIVTQKGEHGDPKILEPFVALAKRENLPMRAPMWRWKTNYGAQSFVEAEGIRTTQSIHMGIKDWRGELGFDLETELEELIEQISAENNGVSELLLFIGFAGEEMFKLSSISWQRGQILNIAKRKYHIIEKIRESFDIVGFGDIE